MTIFVFLVVGASLPFAVLADNRLPAFAVVAVLLRRAAADRARLRAARPGRAWERNELAFLCWTRETGVVPAALVGVLAGLGVPGVDRLAGGRRARDHGDAAAAGHAGGVAGAPARPARRPGTGPR